MKLDKVTKTWTSVKKTLSKNSPAILIGGGTALMFVAVGTAIGATPKALQLIEAKKKEEHKDKLTPLETVQATWKCYIPTVAAASAGAACIIGGCSVNGKRNAALAAAYKLTETAYTEYKDKVKAELGEKKEQIIRDKIAQDKVDKTPVNSSNVIITGNGHTLCLDTVFGQYFESDIDTIKKAVNEFNYQLLSRDYMSLNDFYDELGIKHIEIGDQVGWNIHKSGQLEISFSSALAADGRPCLTLSYMVHPEHDYDRFGY